MQSQRNYHHFTLAVIIQILRWNSIQKTKLEKQTRKHQLVTVKTSRYIQQSKLTTCYSVPVTMFFTSLPMLLEQLLWWYIDACIRIFPCGGEWVGLEHIFLIGNSYISQPGHQSKQKSSTTWTSLCHFIMKSNVELQELNGTPRNFKWQLILNFILLGHWQLM